MAWESTHKSMQRLYIGYIHNQPTIQKSFSTKFFRIRQTASNEFQCKKIVLCQQQTPLLHTLPISSFFIYLLIKDHVKHQGRSFLQQQKVTYQGLFYPFTVLISNNVLFKKRNALLSTEISKNTCNSASILEFFIEFLVQ